MNKIIIGFIPVLALLVLGSCNNAPEKEETAASAAPKIPAIVLENMNPSISPKVDFNEYVNGGWEKHSTIPPSDTKLTVFDEVKHNIKGKLLNIVNEAIKNNTYQEGTDQKKAILVFQTAVDTVGRKNAGTGPIQPYLDKIDAIKNLADLQTLLATEPAVGNPFFGLGASPDLNNSSRNALYLTTGGLGLPDRDYYVADDEKSKLIRNQYVEYIKTMLRQYGEDEATAGREATTILALETQLAKPRYDKLQNRDIRNWNNPRTKAELQKLIPAMNIAKYFEDMGIPNTVDSLIVVPLPYVSALNDILKKAPVADLKTLLRWESVNNLATALSPEIGRINFDFYDRKLNGTEAQKPVDESALDAINVMFADAVGKIYVDAEFPPEAKEKAKSLIQNVIAAFKNRIQAADWLGEETRAKANEKLDKMKIKIGYPDKWESYASLDVKSGNSYMDNIVAFFAYARKKSLDDIGQPVDKIKWSLSPQTVNAQYNPQNNEILFPAAILQPPYFNFNADDAVNYGAMGAAIGHEITHAFDDGGSRFDAEGNLVNWWTPNDLKAFQEKGLTYADQFDKIEVLPGYFVNGKFTLGENIADLGGVSAAFDAFQKSLKENGNPGKIDGFTPEQRFFIAWATVWRTLIREEAQIAELKTNKHAPGKIRTTQPLKNLDAFYTAFDIKEGDPVYLAPEKRVKIW